MSQEISPRRARARKSPAKSKHQEGVRAPDWTIAVLGVSDGESLDPLRRVLPRGSNVVLWNSPVADRATALVAGEANVDQRVLERCHELRVVVKFEGSEGRVDEAACARRGVQVHYMPSIGAISVAEHTILLMLALEKEFDKATSRLRSGAVVGGMTPTITTQETYAYNWVGLRSFDALYGKRIGLVGLGKIGREVAIRLRAFGVDVAYTKRSRISSEEELELAVTFMTFQQLLETSDYVSLHLRFYPETERLMGDEEFRMMKPGSFFVNTARGRLIDEKALIDALESSHLRGAALDVFWYEPLPDDSPLLNTRNLILTPHTGGIPTGTGNELEAAGRLIARQLES